MNQPKLKIMKEIKTVKNNYQIPELKMRSNENWDFRFRRKTKDIPLLLMGIKVGLKYHIKQVFYLDGKFIG